MAKMLVKTSENELKTVFVMKLNANSLKIYKTTLHSANVLLAEVFKVA